MSSPEQKDDSARAALATPRTPLDRPAHPSPHASSAVENTRNSTSSSAPALPHVPDAEPTSGRAPPHHSVEAGAPPVFDSSSERGGTHDNRNETPTAAHPPAAPATGRQAAKTSAASGSGDNVVAALAHSTHARGHSETSSTNTNTAMHRDPSDVVSFNARRSPAAAPLPHQTQPLSSPQQHIPSGIGGAPTHTASRPDNSSKDADSSVNRRRQPHDSDVETAAPHSRPQRRRWDAASASHSSLESLADPANAFAEILPMEDVSTLPPGAALQSTRTSRRREPQTRQQQQQQQKQQDDSYTNPPISQDAEDPSTRPLIVLATSAAGHHDREESDSQYAASYSASATAARAPLIRSPIKHSGRGKAGDNKGESDELRRLSNSPSAAANNTNNNTNNANTKPILLRVPGQHRRAGPVRSPGSPGRGNFATAAATARQDQARSFLLGDEEGSPRMRTHRSAMDLAAAAPARRARFDDDGSSSITDGDRGRYHRHDTRTTSPANAAPADSEGEESGSGSTSGVFMGSASEDLPSPPRMLGSIAGEAPFASAQTALSTFFVDPEILDIANQSSMMQGGGMAAAARRAKKEAAISKGKNFSVRQRRNARGKMEFDTNFLLLKENDSVTFVWFSSEHHIFEVDSQFCRALPHGKHSLRHEEELAPPPLGSARENSSGGNRRSTDIKLPGDTSDGSGESGKANVLGLESHHDQNRQNAEEEEWRRLAEAGGYRSYTVTFTAPGDYYFVCPLNKKLMRLHVQVVGRRSRTCIYAWLVALSIAIAIGLVVMVILVLAFWLQKQDLFLSREDAASQEQYDSIKSVQRIISFRFFPWFALGILMVLVVIIVAIGYSIVRCFYRARQGSHHRGVKSSHRRILYAVTVTLAVVLIIFMFASYGVQLNACDAFNNFALSLSSAISSTVSQLQLCTSQGQWLVQEAPALLAGTDVDIPFDQISDVVDTVDGILHTVQTYTTRIEDLIEGAFRLLPILLFLVLQYGLFACIFLIGSIIVGYSRPLKSAVWMIAVCSGVFACAVGVVFAERDALHFLYNTGRSFDESPEGAVVQWGVAPDSPVARIFSLCDVDEVQVGALVNYTNDIMQEINKTLDEDGQAMFSELFAVVNGVLPVGIEAIVNYTDYVMLNLDILQEILDTQSTGENPNLTENLVPVLKVAISLIQNLMGLANCQIFRNVITDALELLHTNIRSSIDSLFALMLVLFVLCCLLQVASAGAAYAASFQRKYWYEPRTGRWFRFHYCYRVHHRTLAQAPKEKRVALSWNELVMGSQKPFIYHMLMDQLVLYTAACLSLFNCILLALFNEITTLAESIALMRAQAYLGAAFLFVLLIGFMFRNIWIRRGVTLFALLIIVAAAVVSLAQASISFSKATKCSKPSTDSNSQYFTACPVIQIGYYIEVGIYTLVAVLNYVTIIVCVVFLLVFMGRMRPHLRPRPYVGKWKFVGRWTRVGAWLVQDHFRLRRVFQGTGLFLVALLLILIGLIDSPSLVFVGSNAPSSTILDGNIMQVIDPAVGCNGDKRYCHLRVTEIIWACAHNAHSSAEDGFVVANHYYNITRQLEAGIRYFMIDVWYDRPGPNSTFDFGNDYIGGPAPSPNGTDSGEEANQRLDELDTSNSRSLSSSSSSSSSSVVSSSSSSADTEVAFNVNNTQQVYLCHTVCLFGRRPLLQVLRDINHFMRKYPGEVIQIVVEQYVNSSDLGTVVMQAGLGDLLWYNPTGNSTPSDTPDYQWPTIGELVQSGQRVMFFNDVTHESPYAERGVPEWLYFTYRFQFENSYATADVTQWRCGVDRGWCNEQSWTEPWKYCRCDEYFNGGIPDVIMCNDSSSSSGGEGSSWSSSSSSPLSLSASSASSSSSLSGEEGEEVWCSHDGNIEGCNCTDVLDMNATDKAEWRRLESTNCERYNPGITNFSDSRSYVLEHGHLPSNIRSKIALMNHMITNEIGSPVQASRANTQSDIEYMVHRCSSEWNQLVAVVAVDYWNIGNPLLTIQGINQHWVLAKNKGKGRSPQEWAEALLGRTTIPTDPYASIKAASEREAGDSDPSSNNNSSSGNSSSGGSSSGSSSSFSEANSDSNSN